MAQITNIVDFSSKTQAVSKNANKDSKDNGFLDVMNANLSSGKDQTKNASYQTKQDVKSDYENMKSKNAITDLKSNVSKTSSNSDISSTENVEELNDAIKKELGKILNISEEEIEKFLVESGLTALDLLNPDVLKSLVLEVANVTDVSELLTNEDLSNQLTSVLDVMKTFKEEHADAITEALQSQIPVEETTETFEEVIKNLEPAKELTVKEEVPDTKKDVAEIKEPIVTVEKDKTYVEQASKKDSGNKNNNETSSDNMYQQFVDNLTNAVSETSSVEGTALEKVQQMQDIVHQVVEQIKVTLSAETTSMEMHLNPGNLGKVHVSIISRAGQMTATFAVENQIAKEALESQLATLRENLSEQGLKVDAIEVTVAEHGLNQNDFADQQQSGNSNQSSTKKTFLNRGFEEDSEEEQEEEIPVANQILGNGTVDFSA